MTWSTATLGTAATSVPPSSSERHQARATETCANEGGGLDRLHPAGFRPTLTWSSHGWSPSPNLPMPKDWSDSKAMETRKRWPEMYRRLRRWGRITSTWRIQKQQQVRLLLSFLQACKRSPKSFVPVNRSYFLVISLALFVRKYERLTLTLLTNANDFQACIFDISHVDLDIITGS